MAFTHLSDLLGKSVRKKGLASQVEAALAVEHFNTIAAELLGDHVSGSMRALYLKDKVLTIAVLSPVLAQELKLREPDILRRLAERLGDGCVERFRFLS